MAPRRTPPKPPFRQRSSLQAMALSLTVPPSTLVCIILLQTALLPRFQLASAADGTRDTGALSLDLSKAPWTLSNRNGSIQLPTSIPVYAHTALQQAGIITDPLVRYGELESRQVPRSLEFVRGLFSMRAIYLARHGDATRCSLLAFAGRLVAWNGAVCALRRARVGHPSARRSTQTNLSSIENSCFCIDFLSPCPQVGGGRGLDL